MKMRLFIAIDVNNEIKNNAMKIINKLKKCNSKIKPVEKDNLHITLKFIGEVEEKRIINTIKDQINTAKKSVKPFKIHIKGVNYFERFGKISVIWAGIKEGEDEIKRLINNMNKYVTFGKNSNKAHLTLCRVKFSDNCLLEYIKSIDDIEIGQMHVKEIKLKKSLLTPSGPIYEDIHMFKL